MSSSGLSEVDVEGGAPSGADRLDAIRLRLVESIETEPAAELAAGAVRRATAAVVALGDVDCSALDAGELRAWLEGVEELRRSIDATTVATAGTVDRHNPFRSQGLFHCEDRHQTHVQAVRPRSTPPSTNRTHAWRASRVG
jgi:hypothetical protein